MFIIPRISKTLSMVIVRVFSFILSVTAVNLEYQPDCDMEASERIVGAGFLSGSADMFPQETGVSRQMEWGRTTLRKRRHSPGTLILRADRR